MDLTYENIEYSQKFPLKIFLHNLNYMQNHWHDSMEILFILEGSIHLGIGNSVFHLHEEDLIVINPNEIHTSKADRSNLVLALQISNDWINENTPYKDLYVNCNSSNYDDPRQLDQIRQILASMLWFYNKKSTGFELKVMSYLFELLYQLFNHFPKQDSSLNEIISQKHLDRMTSIINFLNENFCEDISLQDIAKQEHLSTSYISRFISKYMGTSFKEFLIRIRLENALKDLLYTDKSILQLSLDNGFPSSKSFLYAFKKYYDETPSSYRRKAKADYQFLFGQRAKSNNYFEVEHLDMYSSLYKYLHFESSRNVDYQFVNQTKTKPIEININQTSFPINKTWKKLIAIGKASDVFNPEIQNQLERAQSDIGFSYLRFHGLFDDDMWVYREDEQGNPILNFEKTDRLIDHLITIGLKPFFELGFMPSQLAKTQHIIFHKPSVISIPKDIRKWCYLIREFIVHCIQKYGKSEVLNWYFEFWNEPELTDVFWNDSFGDYLAFYNETYKTIKEISSKIQFGGPAISFTENLFDWLENYFIFCKNKNCLPEFFSYHIYYWSGSVDIVKKNILERKIGFSLPEDPEYFKKTLSKLSDFIADYGFNPSQSFMTEWNAGPSHRDLSHDTAFMAAYIVKNILENYEKTSSFGFWTLSDIIEEFQVPKETFHGGTGLITKNGLRKAGYYGFTILNEVGDEKITSGPGYFISKDKSGIQIFMYNYCHFDPLYCSMDRSAITSSNRYGIFKDSVSQSFKFILTGFPPSDYEITDTIINRNHGSSFDSWVELGASENISDEDIRYLLHKSVPLRQKSKILIQNELSLSRTLLPHEVRLVRISKIRSIA